MDYKKILTKGTDSIANLIQTHADSIAKLYEDGERKDAIDINLKFRIEAVKGNKDAVKVKTGISFTTDRIKEERVQTVDAQGDMFEEEAEVTDEPTEDETE
jgi:hypothetical protein